MVQNGAHVSSRTHHSTQGSIADDVQSVSEPWPSDADLRLACMRSVVIYWTNVKWRESVIHFQSSTAGVLLDTESQ